MPTTYLTLGVMFIKTFQSIFVYVKSFFGFSCKKKSLGSAQVALASGDMS
jgi:hypothetical protein